MGQHIWSDILKKTFLKKFWLHFIIELTLERWQETVEEEEMEGPAAGFENFVVYGLKPQGYKGVQTKN